MEITTPATPDNHEDARPAGSRPPGIAPIIALVVVHAFGLIVLNAFYYYARMQLSIGQIGIDRPLSIVWLATPFCQASLLAFWTGVSRRSAIWRFGFPLAPLLGICLVSFVWERLAFGRPGNLPNIALVAQWFVMALLFDRVFRAQGWRIRQSNAAKDCAEKPQLLQFGIKHLLIGTTIIAIALAVGRVVLPNLDWDRGNLPGFVLFGTFNCVYLVPLMALSLRDRGWAIGVALALAWTVLVTYAERVVFGHVYAGLDHTYLFGLNGIQALVIVSSLLVVRAAGWRLMR